MPAGLLPNESLAQQLNYLLHNADAEAVPWQLMFFTNDIPITSDTALADLIEATFGGYSRLDLDPDEWTEPDVNEGCAHSTWGEVAQIWFVTSGPLETLYGCAYVDTTTGRLVFAQRFDDEDIEPVTVGGRVSILPQYTLTSAEC